MKFFSCEICLEDIDHAWAAMAALAALGIESKIFGDVVDPYSAAVFVVAWRDGNASFEETVTEIADAHGGRADCFGARDHIPVPSDFNFTPEAA